MTILIIKKVFMEKEEFNKKAKQFVEDLLFLQNKHGLIITPIITEKGPDFRITEKESKVEDLKSEGETKEIV